MKHLVLLILFVFTAPAAFACTGFYTEAGGKVYFAANEDWFNPYAKIWTVPEDEDNYGLLILGFSNMYPQTIVNSRGLAMDGFATEVLEVNETRGKKNFDGNLFLEVFKKCATVEEALEMIDGYNLDFLSQAQILIGDKTGDSALIEGDVIHRKEGPSQVATNFYLSKTDIIRCSRYNIASYLLNNDEISRDDLPSILDKTKQYNLTQYSYIFDLTEGTMELFFFGDFENPRTFNIHEEIRQGSLNIDLPDYFENENYNWYLMDYQLRKPQRSDLPISEISNYTGYYHSRSMRSGFNIIESDGSLKLVLDGAEYDILRSKDGSFFFDKLDYVLWFQFEKRKKATGIYIRHNYFQMNEYARKIHPFWSWFYR